MLQKKLISAALTVVFFSLCISLLSVYFYYESLINFINEPGSHQTTADVIIEEGASAKSISERLKKLDLIGSAQRFYHYIKYVDNSERELDAGEYSFEGTMKPIDILTMLKVGKIKLRRFTVFEGSRKEDIAREIEKAGIARASAVLAAMHDEKLAQEFAVPADVPGGFEGYLFPDTYQFPRNTNPIEILRTMHKGLTNRLDEAVYARMKELGFTLHQTLTLASIIEKETGNPSERARISGVFHNRLKKGMKLQTDPTVAYGFKDLSGKDLRYSHLRTAHPYNTYVNRGLPPGPIASPGIKAIIAALWPMQTKDLYFVSKNDGSHEFCATYSCHHAAVKRWQIDYFKQKRALAATQQQAEIVPESVPESNPEQKPETTSDELR